MAPVQDAFAHDVVETHGYKPKVNQHFPETEETR